MITSVSLHLIPHLLLQEIGGWLVPNCKEKSVDLQVRDCASHEVLDLESTQQPFIIAVRLQLRQQAEAYHFGAKLGRQTDTAHMHRHSKLQSN